MSSRAALAAWARKVKPRLVNGLQKALTAAQSLRPPFRPRAWLAKLKSYRWWAGAALAALVLERAVNLLGASDPVSRAVCSVSFVRQQVCRPRGWGNVPTPEEERRYAAARRRNCSGLREFIRTEAPDNPLMAEARQRWDTRFQKVRATRSVLQRVELFVTADGLSMPVAARALDSRARRKADSWCSQSLIRRGASIQEIKLEIDPPRCTAEPSGWSCAADATAVCTIRYAIEATVERC
jgi:hypothetical protein